MAHGKDGRSLDPGTRLILEELRDLRVEMRADRVRSDERFAAVMRDFREDSARREAATRKAFKEIRTVGLSIVKTLNHHTRILQRIDGKLGARGNGRPGGENGRRT